MMQAGINTKQLNIINSLQTDLKVMELIAPIILNMVMTKCKLLPAEALLQKQHVNQLFILSVLGSKQKVEE